MLPEKWRVLGSADAIAAAAQPLDGPVGRLGGSARGRARHRPHRRLVHRAPSRGRSAPSTRALHFAPGGELRAAYRKLHMFDVEVDGSSTPSPRASSRARRSSSPSVPSGAPTGDEHLLRPALPRALPRAVGSWRGDHDGPGGVHADDDTRPLGGPRSRAGDREPVLRDRRQPDRHPTPAVSGPADAR